LAVPAIDFYGRKDAISEACRITKRAGENLVFHSTFCYNILVIFEKRIYPRKLLKEEHDMKKRIMASLMAALEQPLA